MSIIANSPEAKIVGKNRIKAMAFFGLAASVGIVGLFLIMRYMDNIKMGSLIGGKNGVATGPTMPVVVAAMDLPIATQLEANHLRVLQWPKDSVPVGAHQTVKSLVGQTTVLALVKNEPVLVARIANSKDQGMAALLSKGKRAMAVKVDSVVGVAGFVRPGDFVDVITTMAPDDETREQLENRAAKMSKIILQNIKVLAVGEHLETKNRKPTKVKVVTLEVDAAQSEKLALGSQHGKLQLTMRSRIDQELENTTGVTPKALLVSEEDLDSDVDGQESEKEVAQASVRKERRYKAKKRNRSRLEEKVSTPVVRLKAPDEPVVEILRGGSVEKRKLMKSVEN